MKTIINIRTGMFAFLLLAISMAAQAQDGLQTEQVFKRFGHEKGCLMVVRHNTKMKGYPLHVYKSLVYKRQGTQIAPYVDADRKQAKKIREVVKDGHVVSGYYMLPPIEGRNRYILFMRENEHAGVLIYIEGNLSPDDIMKLCYVGRRK